MKVADLLESKFFEFTNDVKVIVPDAEALVKEMASDENVDQIEVMDTVLFLFPDDRYTYHLDQLLELKSIHLEVGQKEKLIPVIEKYVTVLRKIKVYLNQ